MNRFKMFLKKVVLLIMILITSTPAFSQEVGHLDGISELLRTNDKFYVVISVIVTIFVGFFLYLIRIEKKLRNMEKQFSEK